MKLIEKRRRKVSINIISLIDVVLLLLIFFMLTSSFVEQPGLKLDLPNTKSSVSEKSNKMEISILADGEMFLNGKAVSLNELEDIIRNQIKDIKDKSLLLRADKNVPYGKVVKVMDIARISGLEKIIIATELDSYAD